MKMNFKKIGIGVGVFFVFLIIVANFIPAPEETKKETRVEQETINSNPASNENNVVEKIPVEPFIGKVMCTNPNDNEAWRAEITHTIDQEKIVRSTIIVGDKGKNPPQITEGKIIDNSKEKVSWSSTFPGDKFAGQVYKGEIDLKAGTLYTDFNFARPKERDFRILEGWICKILN